MRLGSGYDAWRTQTPEEYWGTEFACEECPCDEVELPKQVSYSPDVDEVLICPGAGSSHEDACGCDLCECGCHSRGL